MDQSTNEIAQKAGDLLIQTQLYLCIAESCTGGLLGHLITNIPGCSDYFLGGVQAYSYQTKTNLLSVKQTTLEQYGAVSHETAYEMACGVRQLFTTQHAIDRLASLSITGIAGPGGGMPQKPVGLVWIGLSWKYGTYTWRHYWQGDREENKMNSAIAALQHLIETVKPD
jgi:PncC family amidohydrolase